MLRAAIAAAIAMVMAAAGACSGGSDGAADRTLHVTLITKDPNDPFWVAMIDGAKQAAAHNDVQVTVASGKDQTDTAGQIRAIQNATTRGDDAIMIANNGPAVNDAIKKAEEAGVFVIALDTPTSPTDLVSATYATDNFHAGQLIGRWTAATLGGKKATIALIDLFGDKIVSIDYQRDQGFLKGMGISLHNPKRNGDEAPTGRYSKGPYRIVCNQTSDGAEAGARTAMEKCLSLNPAINVVYTANEPSALGAAQALKAAGNDALVVTINGSCDGIKSVASGKFDADAQQYPRKMGADGVKAVVQYVRHDVTPKQPKGKDFIATGTSLVTDDPVKGLDSITSRQAKKTCY